MNMKSEISDLDLSSPILKQKKPLTRFIFTSGFVHILAATAILLMHQAPTQEPEKDLIEVDLTNVSTGAPAAPVLAEKPEQIAKAPVVAKTPTAPKIISKPTAPVVAPIKAAKVVEPAVNTQPEIPTQAETAPEQAELPPKTLDDIPTPTLDNSPVAVPVSQETAQKDLNMNELDQALDQAQATHKQQLAATTTQLDADTQDATQDLAAASAAAQARIDQEKAEAQAQIAARTEALKQAAEQKEQEEHAAALAAQQAAEKAEEQKAAQIAAERAAVEKAAAAQAAAVAAAKVQQGDGQKDAGPGTKSSEVRALEQLRQMPGNPKPQYSNQERLQGQKGVAIFQAFVTEEGRLTNFKMIRSTGYRNLDAKTLKALKQWKFYPGQEGWVELPIDWDLKGDPQEMPAYLRRQVGQGNSGAGISQ